MTLRGVAAVCSAILLSACATKPAPPGDVTTAPELRGESFITADGLTLPVRQWLPEGDPAGVVVGVHGFNDYSKSFDVVPDAPGVGPTLAASGFAVFSYDQRGFGGAPHTGLWPGQDVLAADFADLASVLGRTYPDIPVYAIGVSMGGAVVTAAMTGPAPPPVDAVVLVAPAVWSRSTMPWLYRSSLWFGAHLFPGLKPSGRGLGRRASDNIEMLRDNGRDPLFIKDTRVDTIYGLTNLMDTAQANIGRLPVPALYVYGAKDEIIPKDATQQAVSKFADGSPHRRFAFYDAGWHMMLRDLQADVVLNDVATFFGSSTAALPSGADVAAVDRLKAAEK